jgi:hypothetical protein
MPTYGEKTRQRRFERRKKREREDAPIVEALGRVPSVPLLILPHRLAQSPTLPRDLLLPLLLRPLNQHIDRVPPLRIDEHEPVRVEGMLTPRLGFFRREGSIRVRLNLVVVPALDLAPKVRRKVVNRITGMANDGEEGGMNGAGSEVMGVFANVGRRHPDESDRREGDDSSRSAEDAEEDVGEAGEGGFRVEVVGGRVAEGSSSRVAVLTESEADYAIWSTAW